MIAFRTASSTEDALVIGVIVLLAESTAPSIAEI
jgi:hypothetical protein